MKFKQTHLIVHNGLLAVDVLTTANHLENEVVWVQTVAALLERLLNRLRSSVSD